MMHQPVSLKDVTAMDFIQPVAVVTLMCSISQKYFNSWHVSMADHDGNFADRVNHTASR
jgi:hypothetical protein